MLKFNIADKIQLYPEILSQFHEASFLSFREFPLERERPTSDHRDDLGSSLGLVRFWFMWFCNDSEYAPHWVLPCSEAV